MVSRRSILTGAAAGAIALGFPRVLRAAPVILLTVKQRLGGSLYLYVNAGGATTVGGVAWGAGDDANDGWSEATPKKTMQAAYDYAKSSFDFNGYGMEIHLCPTGTHYAPLNAVSQLEGYHIFNIIGDRSSPNSCIIEAAQNGFCVSAQDYAGVGVIGVGLIGSSIDGSGSGLIGRQHVIFDWDSVAFWGMTGAHVQLVGDSTGSAVGPEIIYGGAGEHWAVSDNSEMTVATPVTVNSALAFGYFLLGQSNGVFHGAPTFSGAGAGAASSGYPYYLQGGARANGVTGIHTPPGNLTPYCAPDSTVN